MSGRGRFVLHIGLAKSGTTYLRDAVFDSRDSLERHGVALVPSRRHAHYGLAISFTGQVQDSDPPVITEARERFAAAAARSEAPVSLYSHELMAPASSDAIEELLALLPDHEVHLLLTVRDPAMALSSSWQQNVQQRHTVTFEQMLRGVREGEGTPGWFFREGQDVPTVLRRWNAHVPPERTHVVVVPPRGAAPELLLDRFCAALGVDPAAVLPPAAPANQTLGAVQAELLRRVNVALGDRLPHPRAGYRATGKAWLGGRVLQRQRGDRPLLPARARPWVEQLADDWIEHLVGSGVVVHGDPEELRPRDEAFAADDAARHEQADAVLDAAVTALADVLELRHAEQQEALVAAAGEQRPSGPAPSLARRVVRRARRGLAGG